MTVQYNQIVGIIQPKKCTSIIIKSINFNKISNKLPKYYLGMRK